MTLWLTMQVAAVATATTTFLMSGAQFQIENKRGVI